MSLHISTQLTSNGLKVVVNHKYYTVSYPARVWSAFPKKLRQSFAETAAYFFTYHFSLANKKLVYDFAPPALQSMFFHAFVYSYPEMVIEFPEGKFKTTELLRDIFNAGFNIKFQKSPQGQGQIIPQKLSKKSAILPFSFGKDSLLTYSVAREIGLDVYPFFFREPTSPIENVNKERSIGEFKKEFAKTIAQIDVTLGALRQARGFMLGWDLILMQYTLLLLPFTHFHKAGYFFWSNEKSTDEREFDKEGFSINPTFEQSVEWVLHFNNLLRTFSSNASLTTLLEPLHELMVLYILHKRYPAIGKYQLSCFNDSRRSKRQRWCGVCYECARVYLFLRALGIDPKPIGLVDDMFRPSMRKQYYLFDNPDPDTKQIDILFQSNDERLLSFYFVYKRGIKGPMVDLFKTMFLNRVEKNKRQLFDKYFKLYPSKTIPNELVSPVTKIYTEELKKARKELIGLL